MFVMLQGKLLHCEPPPGVDRDHFKPAVSRVKKEKSHTHSDKQLASAVGTLYSCCGR